MRHLLWISFLVLALVRPAGAGWIEDRDGKTVIHVKLDSLLMPDPNRTDTGTRANAAAVKEFCRRFPDIFAEKYRARYEADPATYGHHNWADVAIELERHSGIQVEGVENALLAIAGGVSPDVMYVNFRQSDTYIQQRFLYPLDRPEDGYLAAMTDAEKAFRIHPKIWPVIDRKGPDGAKHVWAVPYGGALGRIVTYRKDLFEEAGVPFPTNDWTWADFLAACKKITDPATGVYGVYMGKGKQESWYWTTFLWSAGGDALAYDEANDQWRAVFDSDEAAVALDFYTRLCTEPWTDKEGRKRYGYVYRDISDGYEMWERGRVGMLFQYIDEKAFTFINPDITGMAPVPKGPTGLRGAELNSRMMGLFSGIADRAVRDAAWELIRYYDSEDAMRIKTQVLVEGGLGRFINPRYLEQFGYGDLIRLAPKGWRECFEIAMETGRPEPYGRNANYAYNIMTTPMEEAADAALDGGLPAGDGERRAALKALLHRATVRANREMLGLYTPRERLARRVTAFALFIAIVLAFRKGLRTVIRDFSPADPARRLSAAATTNVDGGNVAAPLSRRVGGGWDFKKYAWAYLLLIPAAGTILFWQYVPLLRGSLMAFQDYRLVGASPWVWLDNFGDVLWNADWWRAVWNSVRYSTLVISLTFLPPLVLAILLQEIPRGKMLFRLIYYLPAVVTGLVVILLWKNFYEPSERGALNAVLMKIPAVAFLAAGLFLLGVALKFSDRLRFHEHVVGSALFLGGGLVLCYTCCRLALPMLRQAGVPLWQRLFLTLPEPYRWLGDSDTAMFACVLPMVWAGMGPGCLIYLAALKGISDEFYEAADMDGATFVDKVLFIIVPILKYLLVINFVGVFIHSWNAEANILAMTGGSSQTEVAGLHIFYKAFIYLKFGPATAMAWMLGFMLIGFTVQQLRMLSRMEFRTVGDK